MYLYIHTYGEKKTNMCIGFQNAARSCKVGQNINISYTHVHVYTRTDTDTECISARHPPLRTAKPWGVWSRTIFPAAAPAARCHASHRGPLERSVWSRLRHHTPATFTWNVAGTLPQMHKLARQTHTPHTHATRDQTQNRIHVYLTSFGEIILELYRVLLAADLPDTPRVTDAASATHRLCRSGGRCSFRHWSCVDGKGLRGNESSGWGVLADNKPFRAIFRKGKICPRTTNFRLEFLISSSSV